MGWREKGCMWVVKKSLVTGFDPALLNWQHIELGNSHVGQS